MRVSAEGTIFVSTQMDYWDVLVTTRLSAHVSGVTVLSGFARRVQHPIRQGAKRHTPSRTRITWPAFLPVGPDQSAPAKRTLRTIAVEISSLTHLRLSSEHLHTTSFHSVTVLSPYARSTRIVHKLSTAAVLGLWKLR